MVVCWSRWLQHLPGKAKQAVGSSYPLLAPPIHQHVGKHTAELEALGTGFNLSPDGGKRRQRNLSTYPRVSTHQSPCSPLQGSFTPPERLEAGSGANGDVLQLGNNSSPKSQRQQPWERAMWRLLSAGFCPGSVILLAFHEKAR